MRRRGHLAGNYFGRSIVPADCNAGERERTARGRDCVYIRSERGSGWRLMVWVGLGYGFG